MADMPPGTVWLASYPKSGNTWMRLLLSNLLSGQEAEEDINNMTMKDGSAANRTPFEDETAADSTLLTLAEIERMRPDVHDGISEKLRRPAFVKVHDAFVRSSQGTPVLGRAARAAVYLVRDPRDVAVSFAAHVDSDLSAMVKSIADDDASITKGHVQLDHRLLGWSGHVTSWLDQRETPTFVIRYEDLRADAAGVFARALDFLGATVTSAEVDRAVRNSDFAALQQQEAAKGFRERIGAAPFFRSGRAGAWRETLTEPLAADIVRAHGAVMARLGYAL